jgi:hypothetical protein
VVVLLARVGPGPQVVVADAEIALIRRAALILAPQRMRGREGVLEAAAEVDAVERPAEHVRDLTVRGRRDDRGGVVGCRPVGVERQRGLVLFQRAIEADAEPLLRLVSLPRRHRVPRIERIVAEPQVERRSPARGARLRRDVDHDEASLVRVGRVDVPAEADRLDLRLRRKPAAAEAVDPHHGTGSCELAERVFHLVRIFRQRGNLFRRKHRRERIASRIRTGLARIAPDDEIFRDALDGEAEFAARLAAAHAHLLQFTALEPGRLRDDRVPPGRQPFEDRLTLRARRLRLHRAGGIRHLHLSADDDGATRVRHRDAQRRRGWRLGPRD